MVSRFYGLTHQEVALRRDILGLPKRKGRHPVLDEAQDGVVEAVEGRRHGARHRAERRGGDAGDDHGPGETLNLPMSVIWSAIRNWIDQGWCRPWRPAAHPRAMAPWRCRHCSTTRCGNWCHRHRRHHQPARRCCCIAGRAGQRRLHSTAATGTRACRALVPRLAPDAAGA